MNFCTEKFLTAIFFRITWINFAEYWKKIDKNYCTTRNQKGFS